MTTSKNLSFQERELEILRNAVDRVEKQTAREKINSPQIKKIIHLKHILNLNISFSG